MLYRRRPAGIVLRGRNSFYLKNCRKSFFDEKYSFFTKEQICCGDTIDRRLCGTPEIDRLVERGRIETDPGVCHRIYREIEQIIVRRALLVPLFHEQTYRFAAPEVQDFEVNMSRETVPYEKLWFRR